MNFSAIPPALFPWQLPLFFSAYISLTALYTSCNWNHALLVLLWLTYFAKYIIFQVIHVITNGRISFFFLRLNSIPLCVGMGVWVYTYHTHTRHIFCIYSLVNRYLGCFHIMYSVNNAEIHVALQITLQDLDLNSHQNHNSNFYSNII